MPNLQRSVERVKGVVSSQFDLDTGRMTVDFEKVSSIDPPALWQAVIDSGFTPVRVETSQGAYTGPTDGGG